MKQLFYIALSFYSFLFSARVFAADSLSKDDLKTAIIPDSANDILSWDAAGATWEWFLDMLLGFIRDSIFTLLVLIAIGMFLFIGGRLVMARWNPEEFKKAMKSLVYAVIGILFVSLAWAVVRLISGIDI